MLLFISSQIFLVQLIDHDEKNMMIEKFSYLVIQPSQKHKSGLTSIFLFDEEAHGWHTQGHTFSQQRGKY
jgi:hypothetical protein